MKEASAELDFELAAILRDEVRALKNENIKILKQSEKAKNEKAKK